MTAILMSARDLIRSNQLMEGGGARAGGSTMATRVRGGATVMRGDASQTTVDGTSPAVGAAKMQRANCWNT